MVNLVSIVIPCYRPTEALEVLLREIKARAEREEMKVEFILVNDSRAVEAAKRLTDVSAGVENVTVIHLSRNYGQHNATAAGISFASGDIIVTMDDDLQHPPDAAFEIIEKLESDSEIDLVYGVPRKTQQGFIRHFFGAMLRGALRTTGLGYAHKISPLRAFRGGFRECFVGLAGPYISIDIVLSWFVGVVESRSVDFQPRKMGGSGYSLKKLFSLAVIYFVSFSVLPLRIALFLGLVGSAISAGLALTIVIQYLSGLITEPGFTTLATLTTLLGSLLLLVVGVVGEYIGLQHRRGMGQPLFFARPPVGGGSDNTKPTVK